MQLSEDDTFASGVQTVLAPHSPTTSLRANECGVVPAGYRHGDRYHLRARTVDLAGNGSAWVVEAPASGRLGCSAVP